MCLDHSMHTSHTHYTCTHTHITLARAHTQHAETHTQTNKHYFYPLTSVRQAQGRSMELLQPLQWLVTQAWNSHKTVLE